MDDRQPKTDQNDSPDREKIKLKKKIIDKGFGEVIW